MLESVIQIENLSKKYVLSHQQQGRSSYKSLREVISNKAKSLSQKIFQPTGKKIHNSNREEFWALNDISFNIKQGERVGVIGRNGAGKSTLLKILSRITEPTQGRIEIQGRVASLLEVGTGFHPELTGRENIYLNGAILGMSKADIIKKFDEIVEFAEIEKFLDTPVKRYSSGMYVRLAFAVAAHLEPDILIVDEVLAVGDVAFQSKCLGKMEEVSKNQGRTVLFVSHNMQAISNLTKRCIMLSQGKIQFDGYTDEAARLYIAAQKHALGEPGYYEAPLKKSGNHVAWARVHTSHEQGVHHWGQPITFEFALCITEPNESLGFCFQVLNDSEKSVSMFWLFDSQASFRREPGLFILRCKVSKFRLYMGAYTLRTWLTERSGISFNGSNQKYNPQDLNVSVIETLSLCSFEVTMEGTERDEYEWVSGECAYLEDALWQTIPQETVIL